MDITPIDTVPMDTHPLVDYSYWHLVEMVYIYIYIHLYYYYIRYPPSPSGSCVSESTMITLGPFLIDLSFLITGTGCSLNIVFFLKML